MRRLAPLLVLPLFLACSDEEDPVPRPMSSRDAAFPDAAEPDPDTGDEPDGGKIDGGDAGMTEPADIGPDLGPDLGLDLGPEDAGTDAGTPPCSDLPAPATVVYVDASAPAGGSGGSWAAAFRSLADGLATASAGQQIWVAGGTYTPVVPNDLMNVSIQERETSFELVGGVRVLGGFAGDEARACERDGRATTVLSGDLAGDDLDGDADGRSERGTEENSRQVLRFVSGTGTAELEDLRIVGGQADGAGDLRQGGGLFCREASLVLRRVELADNRSPSPFGGGGGMAAIGCEVVLEDVLFEDNVSEGGGGGLLVDQASTEMGSTLTLRNGRFVENEAVGAGGGADLRNRTTARLTGVRFEANEVTTSGGGLGDGAGLSIDGAAVRVGAGQFIDNVASVDGGGLRQRGGQLRGSHLVFDGNEAGGDGGGFAAASAISDGTSLQYAVFFENSARRGGALHARSPVTAAHLTMLSNSASNVGGAVHTFDGEGPIRIYNSIVWGNRATNGGNGVRGRGIVVSRSVLQDSNGGSPWTGHVANQGRDGGGVIDEAPAFSSAMPRGPDGVFGTADDGLVPASGGPGLDAAPANDVHDANLDGFRREPPSDVGDVDQDGVFDEALGTDLAGALRVVGGAADMGAYEEQTSVASALTLHVDADADGAQDGSSWADAFTELSGALAMARAGDQIWVAEGSYRPGSNRSSSFFLRPGRPRAGRIRRHRDRGRAARPRAPRDHPQRWDRGTWPDRQRATRGHRERTRNGSAAGRLHDPGRKR